MNDMISVQYKDGTLAGSVKALFCLLLVAIVIGIGVCIGMAIARKAGV